MAEGDDELRAAGAQRLSRGADAAVVDDRRRAREDFAEGRVVEGRGPRRQFGRAVARVADEEQRAAAERAAGRERVAVEVLRRPEGRRAEREDDRRRASVEEGEEFGRGLAGVAGEVAPVVEAEARDVRVRRPVGLRLAEQAREEREDERRRVLPLEDGVAAGPEAQLRAQPRDRPRQRARPPAPQTHHGARQRATAAHQVVGRGELRRDGRVVDREEGAGREHAGDPRHAGLLGDERADERERVREQEVGPFDRLEEVVVGVAQVGQDPAEDALGAAPRVHEVDDHPAHLVGPVVGGQRRPHRAQLQPDRLHLLAVDVRRGHGHPVPAPLQLQAQRHVRVHVAERAEGGDDDVHEKP